MLKSIILFSIRIINYNNNWMDNVKFSAFVPRIFLLICGKHDPKILKMCYKVLQVKHFLIH